MRISLMSVKQNLISQKPRDTSTNFKIKKKKSLFTKNRCAGKYKTWHSHFVQNFKIDS